ncbi:hypothetical protein QQX09_00730 [Demequina sp. SYSU T00192]|uniref:YhgE/Pip domain-containing protein n=1 Tax=Demequina litoralis TaxID=3051660 RepID=A0ABT8G5M1_9MICO|nr:hypothetical protein [Demequina sp. SYSU T00192]MDN4474372.1 hypothetical protein [Demequina sp. SYSU T00192]
MSARPFDGTAGAERWGWRALLGVLLVPLVVAGLLAWALAAPSEDLDRVTAAIVNADDPVQVDGQTVPLGREFAGELIGGQAGTGAPDDPGPDASASPAPSGPSFTWVLTNESDAREGLDSGTYAAIVRIPPSFSADATSLSGPAKDAVAATIHVTTTPATAFLDPALTEVVVEAAVASLNQQLTARYLTNVYDGFNQIQSSVAQAADGAAQLAEGADSLASGAEQLAAGADRLEAGLDSLDEGAATLAAGLDRLAASVQALPGETARLAAGAGEVAAALDTEAAVLGASVAEASAFVADLCARPRQPGCTRGTALVARLRSAQQAVDALAGGADQVAAGNAALAAGMPGLVDGADASAAGGEEVAAGAADSAAGGAEVAQGAGSVDSGAADLDDGAGQLADGLADAADQIPTYGDNAIATLSTVASRPVATTVAPAPDGVVSVPLFAVVGLWVGGIVAALAHRAVPRRRLLTAASTAAIAGGAVRASALVGLAQGAVVGIAVARFVDAGLGPRVLFGLATMGIGTVFAVANAGLAAALGGVGRILAAMVGVATLAVGTSSTVPAALSGSVLLLPTDAGRRLLGASLGIGPGGAAIAALVVVAVTGVLLVIVGVARRRTVA